MQKIVKKGDYGKLTNVLATQTLLMKVPYTILVQYPYYIELKMLVHYVETKNIVIVKTSRL